MDSLGGVSQSRERTLKKSPRIRVERRGSVRRLRIDDTYASFYEPGSDRTGSVWDALAAPLVALGAKRDPSVLLLGLGGGSVARIVRALYPGARITGVELEPAVVEAARRHFDLDALELDVVTADAQLYLGRTRRRFDAIVEDIFGGSGREVCKPSWLPDPGLAQAAACLRPGGLLVSNTLDETRAVTRSMGRLFPRRVRIDVRDYDNRILVGGGAKLSARVLRAGVAACDLLAPTLPELRFATLD